MRYIPCVSFINYLYGITYLIWGTTHFSCTSENVDSIPNTAILETLETNDIHPIVEVEIVSIDNFSKEILSTGKVKAMKKVDLTFKTEGSISIIRVRNGMSIRKGDTLAELENFIALNKVRQQTIQLQMGELELEDILIGQGYSLEDSTIIPLKLLHSSKIKSGLEEAKTKLELAKYEFESSFLIAPFGGLIANLNVEEFTRISPNEVFCSLINNKYFDVNFSILESELDLVKIGDRITVKPIFSENLTFTGKVTEINPIVDINGLIGIRGRIFSRHKQLLDGMNVEIAIEKKIPDVLAIPKESVLTRDGKKVVFTYQEGKSLWNYVSLGMENINSFEVIEGLDNGDTIITSGNLNLAHESQVNLNLN